MLGRPWEWLPLGLSVEGDGGDTDLLHKKGGAEEGCGGQARPPDLPHRTLPPHPAEGFEWEVSLLSVFFSELPGGTNVMLF